MQIIKINTFKDYQLKKIIDLHFTESVLNLFGKKFLEIVYSNIPSNKNNIVLLAEDNKGNILGYLVATKDSVSFFKKIVSRNFLQLSIQVLLASLTNPNLLSLALSLFGRKRSFYIRAELQFIAVDRNHQGKGIGTKLLKRLHFEFKKNKISVYRVGTKSSNKKSNQFYLKNNFKYVYRAKVFNDYHNFYLSPFI